MKMLDTDAPGVFNQYFRAAEVFKANPSSANKDRLGNVSKFLNKRLDDYRQLLDWKELDWAVKKAFKEMPGVLPKACDSGTAGLSFKKGHLEIRFCKGKPGGEAAQLRDYVTVQRPDGMLTFDGKHLVKELSIEGKNIGTYIEPIAKPFKTVEQEMANLNRKFTKKGAHPDCHVPSV